MLISKFLFIGMFPRFLEKYKFYLKKKFLEKIEREIKEDLKETEKFSVIVGGLKDKVNKAQWDNVKPTRTFYIKHKKTGRVMCVTGESLGQIKQQYEDYNAMEPMIKDVNDAWDYAGNLYKME